MSIQFQSSVLFVQDIAASCNFYETLLDQEVDMDFGPNIGFKGGFAIWQIDHAAQIIHESLANGEGQLGRKNLELYFETPDIEAAWNRLLDADVWALHPLREQPWGQRVFRVYDPDGHIVEVGEPMPAVIHRFLEQALTPEAVAERTGMPLQIVQQIATGIK
ncbi:MAG: VOC family protein [Anaerolineae bacterium]|nr:VOC family protein [Anaerolineae bacterium]